ncbi:hypothetical protein J2Y45_002468 [Dyadobacter sp. BE34]|uniref:Uncharacterized protein n=1 Tax=Dyadobacter fermentans TaxID=94254 RepID=A0ABU1QVV5_9BACT|nr:MULTISPECIES: hypothetical protein [Dyadobacter]MDR6805223.1 hypothetical protein [Dyadobacter fermentans]MDR7043017.1 hypothetical protein [Dyadobacter sp. BE242]MDR7197329.1 hypothetical protein [Dyadobacter sp. BE34]MDR7262772.1 hypothetical protein [Dyadobacter sp. BE32]
MKKFYKKGWSIAAPGKTVQFFPYHHNTLYRLESGDVRCCAIFYAARSAFAGECLWNGFCHLPVTGRSAALYVTAVRLAVGIYL